MPLAHGPYVLPRCGHAVMAERPELLNALVAQFLRKCGVRVRPPAQARDAEPDEAAAKWGVKNYAKWLATPGVGAAIPCAPGGGGGGGGGGLRGCKVLREDDDTHSPETLAALFPSIGLVIDISREAPPYLDTSLRHCRYAKLPTVSKVCPTRSTWWSSSSVA